MVNSTKDKKTEVIVSGRHIKDFREKVLNVTQPVFAQRLGFERQAVGRWERGVNEKVSRQAVEKLVEVSGYIPEYWYGITECKTQEEYISECETAGLEELAKEEEARSKKTERVKSLLNLCGYGYENMAGKPQYDFISLSSDPADKIVAQKINSGCIHKIIKYDKNETVYFNDNEMTNLLSDLHSLIDFTCYKKLQAERDTNG